MNVWKIDFSYGDKIPDYMREGLRQWVMFGRTPGDFLTAVLQNDLKMACMRADPVNLTKLRTYIWFLHNEVPHCSGSSTAFDDWRFRGGICGGAIYRKAAERQQWIAENCGEIEAQHRRTRQLGHVPVHRGETPARTDPQFDVLCSCGEEFPSEAERLLHVDESV